ncbi:hypothetical protein V5799_024859 [Amblyomma americanum]|uniref:Uncharacterized protein n=1 Tax=Amblyomma americanum TaxID=6943 RepID=A0AAQ4EAW7_AMBAM
MLSGKARNLERGLIRVRASPSRQWLTLICRTSCLLSPQLSWEPFHPGNRTDSLLLAVSAWPGYPVAGRGRPRWPLRAAASVTLLRCAQVREFRTSAVAFGESSVFSVSVSGSAPLSVAVTFHDGVQRRWVTAHQSRTFRFNRLYPQTGSFHVTLKCSNRAGAVTRFAVAVVEEPVSGLSVTVRKPASYPVVPLGEAVELEAELVSGSGLTFHWRLAENGSQLEPDFVETRGRTSIASHRFSAPGAYNVSVSVTNGLASHSGGSLVAYLEQALRVVEAVDGLQADVVNGSHAILLEPCEDRSGVGDSNADAVTPPATTAPRQGGGEPCVEECGGEGGPVRVGSVENAHHQGIQTGPKDRAVTPLMTRAPMTMNDSRLPVAKLREEAGAGPTAAIRAVQLPTNSHSSRQGARESGDGRLPSTQGGTSMSKRVSPRECHRSSAVQFSSHVARGSDVVFVFHFGDGSSQRVEPSAPAVSEEAGSMTVPAASAVVTHHYKRGGRYSVSVTASNPLGNVTRLIDRPLYVGSPAEGLALEPRDYAVVVAGRSASVRATLRRGGPDVSIAWRLRSAADAPLQLRAAGTGYRFEHVFDSPGVYHLAAEATNPVTEGLQLPRPRAETRIFVQEMLQGASLCVVAVPGGTTCAPAELALPTDKRLLLEASVRPSTERALRFLWSLSPAPRQLYVSHHAAVHFRPGRPGKYVIGVTCQNHVSAVSSSALSLHLVERIAGLAGIRTVAPVVVGRPTRLRAVCLRGSDPTFVWDFGDGTSAVVVSGAPDVWHTYNSTGEYWVKVVAYNAFSRAKFETNLFAMRTPCSKPELLINRYTEVHLNEDVHVEASVKTACPVSARVTYSWTVLNATGGQVLPFPGGGAFSQKDFTLAAGTLPVGRYTLSLKARMAPTAVYAVENATLAVIPAPMGISIAGGAWRAIGPSAVVILEAIVKPPELAAYRVTWKCERLSRDGGADCFTGPVPSSLAKRSSRTLRFAASALRPLLGAFLFTATLALGNTSRVAHQVLEASAGGPRFRLIEISCRSCDFDQRVRSHERVVLRVSCQDCDQDDVLDFEWSLQPLLDESTQHQTDNHCYGEGRGTQSRPHDAGVESAKGPQKRVPGQRGSAENPLPQFPPFPDNVANISALHQNGSYNEAFSVHFEAYKYRRRARHGKGARSKARKAPGRADRMLPAVPSYNALASLHHSMHLGEKLEVSGFESSSKQHSGWLILRPGVLIPGFSYAVFANIRRQGSKVIIGEAMERVTVGRGPSGGRCLVQPSTGVALKTVFKVDCSGWNGGREPYTYSVAYSVAPTGFWRQLYRGSHCTSSFWLPPGLTSQHYTVYVSVMIQDADGFQICAPMISTLQVISTTNLPELTRTVPALLPKIVLLFRDQRYQEALNQLQVLFILLRGIEDAPIGISQPAVRDLMKSALKFSVRILRDMDRSSVGTKKAFLQTLNIIMEPPFPGEEHDLIVTSQLLPSLIHGAEVDKAATTGEFEAVMRDLATAVGYLVKSAQAFNTRTWHIFYGLVQDVEAMLKVYFQSSCAPQVSRHFFSKWLDISIFVAFERLPLRFRTSPIGGAYPARLKDLHNVTSPTGESTLTQLHPVLVGYTFPFVAFRGRTVLPYHWHPDIASTFVLNPSGVSLQRQETFEVNFTRQNKQHGMSLLLKAGTVHMHKLQDSQHISEFHLYMRAKAEHADVKLQVYVSSGAGGALTPNRVTIRRISNSIEVIIEKSTLQDGDEYHLIVAREPERLGHWKLTYGLSSFPYYLECFWQRCMQFWPEKDAWDSSGCVETEATDAHYVGCRCQGGSRIMSMVSGVIEATLVEVPAHEFFGNPVNWAVISFLVATAAVYAFVAYWLRVGCAPAPRARRDCGHLFALKTARSTVKHLYLITVRTGPFFDAGTSATVSMILHGETGSTDVIKLTDKRSNHRQVFHRSSSNAFLVGTNVDLGNLLSVEVWHDNAREFPAWFLEDVNVALWGTDRIWYFIFDEWFSSSSHDGRIHREASASELGPSFLRTLKQSLLHALNEHHLWNYTVIVSVCSYFSRGQRLLVILSTVLLSSALSALCVFFMDSEPPTTDVPASSARWIGDAVLVGVVAHLAHQMPSMIFKHHSCAELPRDVWVLGQALLSYCFEVASGWARRGHDSWSSFSSVRSMSFESLPSLYGIYRALNVGSSGPRPLWPLQNVGEGTRGCCDHSDCGHLEEGPQDQCDDEKSSACNSDTSSTEAQADQPNVESAEMADTNFSFRDTVSPLEAALVNLAALQCRVKSNKSSGAQDEPLKPVKRSRSPSLADSDLTCLDFATDSEDSEDEEDKSGMAYKVPAPARTGRYTRLSLAMGSFGWLLLAALILASICILLCCTQMFLVDANFLCLQMTAAAVLVSIFVTYPTQACMVSLSKSVRSFLCHPPHGAVVSLPCVCNATLQRLHRRIARFMAEQSRPLAVRYNEHRRHPADGVFSSKCRRCGIAANNPGSLGGARLGPGRLLHHLVRYPSERKLIAFRRRCLAIAAAFRAARHFISSTVLIAILLADLTGEDVHSLYRQRQSIREFLMRTTSCSAHELECSSRGLAAARFMREICDVDQVYLATGSVLLQSRQMCSLNIGLKYADTDYSRTQASCPRHSDRPACLAELLRCDECLNKPGSSKLALRFQLYNAPLNLLSSVIVLPMCACKSVEFCVSIFVCQLPGTNAALTTRLLQLSLFAVLCCKLRSLTYRSLKLKWSHLFQFWNIHEIAVVIWSLSYLICCFLRARHQHYASTAIRDEADTGAAAETLSKMETACQRLLGGLLFLATLGIVRGLYASRNQLVFAILHKFRTCRRQLLYLTLLWLVYIVSTSWLVRPKEAGKRGLLHNAMAATGCLLIVPGVFSALRFDSDANGCVVELLEMFATFSGAFLTFALVARLFSQQGFHPDLTGSTLLVRDFFGCLKRKVKVIRGQRSRRSPSCNRRPVSRAPEIVKVLLDVEQVASEVVERADRLFAVPSGRETEEWLSRHLQAAAARRTACSGP